MRSGCAQKALWGLEIGLVSVIDIGNHTAFHLDAIQTLDSQERKSKDIDLPDHYAQSILYSKDTLEKFSNYLSVDAYFAKKDGVARAIHRPYFKAIKT